MQQPKGDLVWIQTKGNKNKDEKEKIEPLLTTWDDCDTVQVSFT